MHIKYNLKRSIKVSTTDCVSEESSPILSMYSCRCTKSQELCDSNLACYHTYNKSSV